MRRLVLVVLGLACALPQGPLAAQRRAHFGSGYLLLANDTLGAEQFNIRGDTVDAIALWRVEGAKITRSRLILDSLARPVSGSYSIESGVRAPTVHGTMRWDHDRGELHWRHGDSLTVLSLAEGPVYPLTSFADNLVQAFRGLAVGASDSLRLIQVAYPVVRPARTTRTGERRYLVESRALRDEFEVRPDGGLRHLISEPTKVFLVATEPIDREAEMQRILERDNRTGGLGTLSPRDSLVVEVAGVRLHVDYGSPTTRGRTIWGDVVDWNRLWRAGANLATHLTVDRDVLLGGQLLPRGVYTLWVLPSPTEWHLVVNSETGQWGTRHKPAFDRFRVPMEVASASHEERLRYFVESDGGRHYLGFAWSDRRVRVVIGPAPPR